LCGRGGGVMQMSRGPKVGVSECPTCGRLHVVALVPLLRSVDSQGAEVHQSTMCRYPWAHLGSVHSVSLPYMTSAATLWALRGVHAV
jgi:hypothetical protein